MKLFAAACAVLLLMVIVGLLWRGDGEVGGAPPSTTSVSSPESDVISPRSKITGVEPDDVPFSRTQSTGGTTDASVAAGSPNASVLAQAACISTADAESTAINAVPERFDQQSDQSLSAEPSDRNKSDCEIVTKSLRQAWRIYDITSKKAVAYSTGQPTDKPPDPPVGGMIIQSTLLPHLCLGVNPFDGAAIKFELVAIAPTSYAKILVGENWVSDGTILSPLSSADYLELSQLLIGRQQGPGTNASRERFDTLLAGDFKQLLGPEAVEYLRREEELASVAKRNGSTATNIAAARCQPPGTSGTPR